MKELGDDYVVRSATSYSSTKIISMNKGYAYSYPGRENEDVSTLNIYEDISIRDIYHKQTYVSSYYQIFYQDFDLSYYYNNLSTCVQFYYYSYCHCFPHYF